MGERAKNQEESNWQPWRRGFMWIVSRPHSPGTIFRRETLYEAMGLDCPSDMTPFRRAKRMQLRFMQQFTRLRSELLRQRNIDLVTRPTFGFEVTHPTEQVNSAMADTTATIVKAVERGALRVEHVDLSALDDRQRAERDDARTKLARLRAMVEGK